MTEQDVIALLTQIETDLIRLTPECNKHLIPVAFAFVDVSKMSFRGTAAGPARAVIKMIDIMSRGIDERYLSATESGSEYVELEN